MEILLHTLKHTVLDSIGILPFLFISYLIIEFIEHKASSKIKNSLSKSGKMGSIIGAIFGVFPQCGFSVTASTLYAGRIITVGTLVAVFISTSDEAIPVLLSNPSSISKILPLVLVKVCFAILVGLFIDFVIAKKQKINEIQSESEEHIHEMCVHCNCEKENLFVSAIKHTMSVFLFIFIFSFVLNGIIELIGEENLSKLLLTGNILQPVVAGLIGIIPNCAASILLTELYIDGTISFASVISGLSVGAGVGMIVLLKENKNMKENIKIILGTFTISVLFGIILEVLGNII